MVLVLDQANFNCTIQELKQRKKQYYKYNYKNFNCTIQELKQRFLETAL